MANCYNCGTTIPEGQRIERNAECSSCRRDLRVCKNCRHYSPGSHWDCRESIPEAVHDKERRTFCEFFSPRQAGQTSQPLMDKERDRQAKARFESLFREGPAE